MKLMIVFGVRVSASEVLQSQHIVFLLRQPWSRMLRLALFLTLHRNRMRLRSVSIVACCSMYKPFFSNPPTSSCLSLSHTHRRRQGGSSLEMYYTGGRKSEMETLIGLNSVTQFQMCIAAFAGSAVD